MCIDIEYRRYGADTILFFKQEPVIIQYGLFWTKRTAGPHFCGFSFFEMLILRFMEQKGLRPKLTSSKELATRHVHDIAVRDIAIYISDRRDVRCETVFIK